MREKQFKNTPMGRSKIPARTGEYLLLDYYGYDVNNIGWKKSSDLKKSIEEEHYKHITFSYIKIRYGKIIVKKED